MKRRGFIAVTAFILLLIFAIIGISYWSISRLSTDMILKEAHRIKARNLAQAGAEKVMINIMNQYRLGNYDLTFKPGYSKERIDEEYKKDFGDGRYQVEEVKAYEQDNRDFINQPYVKNRVQIGQYDVWQVTVTGEVPQSGVRATVETLVKVIRSSVQY